MSVIDDEQPRRRLQRHERLLELGERRLARVEPWNEMCQCTERDSARRRHSGGPADGPSGTPRQLGDLPGQPGPADTWCATKDDTSWTVRTECCADPPQLVGPADERSSRVAAGGRSPCLVLYPHVMTFGAERRGVRSNPRRACRRAVRLSRRCSIRVCRTGWRRPQRCRGSCARRRRTCRRR